MLRIFALAAALQASASYCGGGATNPDTNPGPLFVFGRNNITYSPPCPGILGVDLQTGLVVRLSVGGTYSMTQDWSSCGTMYSGAGQVWVDWNRDEVFDEAETVGTWVGSPTQTSKFTIQVPLGLASGLTRMRIVQREGGSLPLNPCATFSWGGAIDIGVLLEDGTGPTPPPTLAPTPASQYCTAGAMNPDDSNPGLVRVTGVNQISYQPPCPGVVGLDDQTDWVVRLRAGGTYSMTQDWSTCGTSYSGVGQVWLDWNRDQVFDQETETVGTWVGSPTQTSTFALHVPQHISAGVTRLRIMMRETGEGGSLPLNPCATFSWGGAIDIGVWLEDSSAPTPPPTPPPSVVVPSIPLSKAYGPGLEPVQRVGTNVFTVQAYDTNGNVMHVGGIVWVMKMIGTTSGRMYVVEWVDSENGAYPAKFSIDVPDDYVLAIGSGSEQLQSSPFYIRLNA